MKELYWTQEMMRAPLLLGFLPDRPIQSDAQVGGDR
jgi:hypothetical protein